MLVSPLYISLSKSILVPDFQVPPFIFKVPPVPVETISAETKKFLPANAGEKRKLISSQYDSYIKVDFPTQALESSPCVKPTVPE